MCAGQENEVAGCRANGAWGYGLKANRKVQPSKKMKRTSPAEAETMSPEELAEEQRSFDRFANGMRTYLREMEKDQRDALLRELHRLGNVKTFLDSFTATNR
jgi:hypothetical protein